MIDTNMTLEVAIKRGIERVREPNWANPLDHLKLTFIDGMITPWVELWCPFNKECNGADPQKILLMQFDQKATVLPYYGPLPDSDEYKAAVASFDGCLTRNKP